MAEKYKMVTPKFLVSFCNLFIPNKMMRGKPIPEEKQKHGCTAIFEPALFSPADKARWDVMIQIADDVCIKEFGAPRLKQPKSFKDPFRDAAEKSQFAGFAAGRVFISLTSKLRPEIVGPDGKTPITDINLVYSGCFGRASIGIYSFNNESKGIAFGINNFKKICDGPKLIERETAEKAFADTGEEDMIEEDEEQLV